MWAIWASLSAAAGPSHEHRERSRHRGCRGHHESRPSEFRSPWPFQRNARRPGRFTSRVRPARAQGPLPPCQARQSAHYTSMDLGNSATLPSDRLLGLLKRRGPMRTSELAEALAITAEAVRQQLNRLTREGLVAPQTESVAGDTVAGDTIRVGRPSQRWRLTPAAEARFPDAHAELTVRLIEAVRAELGEEALDRLVMAHERRARAAYLTELAGAQSPMEKIARLAALRTREGYMAEVGRRDLDGVWLLTENHCPDLRGGPGVSGLLPGGTRPVPGGAGSGTRSHPHRSHRDRGPTLRLSHRRVGADLEPCPGPTSSAQTNWRLRARLSCARGAPRCC